MKFGSRDPGILCYYCGWCFFSVQVCAVWGQVGGLSVLWGGRHAPSRPTDPAPGPARDGSTAGRFPTGAAWSVTGGTMWTGGAAPYCPSHPSRVRDQPPPARRVCEGIEGREGWLLAAGVGARPSLHGPPGGNAHH